MPYPDDKEIFRRVVNQDLPNIPGDVVDENDQNLPADFLERLQDILGYNIKMGFASVKNFFDWLVGSLDGVKKNNIVPLYQSTEAEFLNAGETAYYGGNLTLKDTDKVILQANIIWKTVDETTSTGHWHFTRNFCIISTILRPQTFLPNTHISSTFTHTITAPTAGTAKYEFQIGNTTHRIRMENINVIATVISI